MDRVRFLTLLLLFLGTSPLLGQRPKAKAKPSILFSVRSNPVTSEEFTYLFRKNHLQKEDYTEVKVNQYVDLLVAFKIKVAEAISRGYDTTRAFRKEFASYRAELKKPYLADKDQLAALVQQAYERMKLEVRASHLLVSLPPNPTPADTLAAYRKSLSFRDRVIQGEDFTTLSRTYSEDPSARTNGGDLGYFTVLQMVYPFEEAAYNLKTGEISMPVRTRFGYHLIRVADRRIARGEVEVSHIILRTGTEDDNRVKNKIFDLHAELDAGRSWDEVCSEYSEDATTKNKGGRLRPFGVGALAGVPQFEQVAFSLHDKGEISDPFQTAYGWHIVRLEQRIPIPPFEQAEESLRRRISRDDRLRIVEEQLRTQQLRSYGYSEDSVVKKMVLDLADSTLLQAQWRYRGTTDLRAKNLFTLKGIPYPVDVFVRYAEQEQVPYSLSPAAYLEKLMTNFLYHVLDEWEEEELKQEHPEYRNLVNEYREGILLFTIMEKEVWNKATEDSLGVRNFYNRNNSRYTAGERVRARVFSSDDSVFVHSMLKKVKAGDSLTRSDVKRFKLVLGPRNFAPGENKAVDRVPAVIGLYPVTVESTYSMVQVEKLVPPGVRSLDEIRSQVISDYQDYLEKEWVRNLKVKYPVKVNSKVRKSVIRELTQP